MIESTDPSYRSSYSATITFNTSAFQTWKSTRSTTFFPYRDQEAPASGHSLFENLELHYSPAPKRFPSSPSTCFKRLFSDATGEQGAAWKSIVNYLLGTLLRSLVFDMYSSGARVNEAAQSVPATKEWKGPRHKVWYISSIRWCPLADRSDTRNHVINIVNIADKRYPVDVGFRGSNGPTFPIDRL